MDPNLIVYNNLRGHAVSKGVSFNLDLALRNGLKMLLGATAMEVYQQEGDVTYVFGPNQGRRTFLGIRYSLF